jgi:hypothetical protein
MVDHERWLTPHAMQVVNLLDLSVHLIRQKCGRQFGGLSPIGAFPTEVDRENCYVVLPGKMGSFSIISAMTDVEDKMNPAPPLYSEESRGGWGGGEPLGTKP